ncbi:hypothetical protein D3C71_2232780 [compost metagenome]
MLSETEPEMPAYKPPSATMNWSNLEVFMIKAGALLNGSGVAKFGSIELLSPSSNQSFMLNLYTF